jgi:Phage integrase, N-terminal SAM-like domain
MTPLGRRMIDDMSLRNLAPNTIKSYVQRISGFARYFKTSPEYLGPDHVRAYLLGGQGDRERTDRERTTAGSRRGHCYSPKTTAQSGQEQVLALRCVGFFSLNLMATPPAR